MKDQIKKLQEMKYMHAAKVTEYANAIAALQKVCEHSWCYDGHSHNDAHYVCSICGLEEWR